MKKKLLTLISFLCVSMSYAQTPSPLWTPQGVGRLPPNYEIFAISIVNKDVIWALADTLEFSGNRPSTYSPKILRTTNGGTLWQLYNPENMAALSTYTLVAVDSVTAFVTTSHRTLGDRLFKTDNGGSSWTVSLSTAATGWLAHFFNAQKGIVFNRGNYAKTTNGGDSWVTGSFTGWLTNEIPSANALSNGFAAIGDSIWTGTTRGRVAFTPNGGTTWQFQDLKLRANFNDRGVFSLAFRDARNGLALGITGLTSNLTRNISKTIDGGTTWTEVSYPFTVGTALEYVKGTNGTFILTDYDGFSAYTTNFGQSWVKIDSLTANAVKFLDLRTGWAGRSSSVVNSPAMYKWNGGNILSPIIEPTEIDLKIFPNPTNRYLTLSYAPDFQPTGLTIYDLQGKVILRQNNLAPLSQMIDLQSFAAGTYVVQLRNTEGVVAAQKFVKQ